MRDKPAYIRRLHRFTQADLARIRTNSWLILLNDRRDFGAADSALLSDLAPHFALALAMLAESGTLRLRAAMAEEALALIGVGQAAFDADGRVLAADAIAEDELDLQSSGRPQLRARETQSLNSACAALASGPARVQQIVRIDERLPKDMLLRPAPAISGGLPSGAAAIGLVRQPRREDEASAARVIASTLGLSAREAALAEAMSQGRTIVDAGAELQLTQETARNYSEADLCQDRRQRAGRSGPASTDRACALFLT